MSIRLHRQGLLRAHDEELQSLLCVHIKVHPIALIGSNGNIKALQNPILIQKFKRKLLDNSYLKV